MLRCVTGAYLPGGRFFLSAATAGAATAGGAGGSVTAAAATAAAAAAPFGGLSTGSFVFLAMLATAFMAHYNA